MGQSKANVTQRMSCYFRYLAGEIPTNHTTQHKRPAGYYFHRAKSVFVLINLVIKKVGGKKSRKTTFHHLILHTCNKIKQFVRRWGNSCLDFALIRGEITGSVLRVIILVNNCVINTLKID